MGGKGAAPQNNQMVQFEMEQAAQARAKEERRKQRLDAGTAQINEMFYGTPVYENALPAGLTNFIPGKAGATGHTYESPDAGAWYGGDLQPVGDTGYKYRGLSFTGGQNVPAQYASQVPGDIYELWGPNDQYVGRGGWEELTTGNRTDTGKRVAPPGKKIFDDQFFNDYTQKQLDYNIPQVEDQFSKMNAKTGFALADAGLWSSSAAGDALSDISKQNTNARAGIINSADRATADLRSSISSQQRQALAQLQAQEDPDVASTGALGSVNNSLAALPQLTPLGDLFKPLVIGAGSAYNAFSDASGFRSGLGSRPAGGSGSGSISRSGD